jgi:hypothetical protein
MELPHDDALRWIVTKYAAIVAAHGEVIGEPELLQPTADNFPDEFTHDPESVVRLLERMIAYSPVDEETAVRVRFVEQEEKGGGGCGPGACGTGGGSKSAGSAVRDPVVETKDGYIVDIAVADAGHATLLTTSLARSVGGLVLLEGGEDVRGGELGALSELAAIATGFGVLLLEGAYVYGKSCGGVRVRQGTSLSLMEVSVALGLFARVHDLKMGAVRANLGTTQREALDHAIEWVDSNEAIVTMLRDPDDHYARARVLADGFFTIEPVRGVLGRLFGRNKKPAFSIDEARPSQKSARTRTPEQQKKLDEARALVEEALGEG